MSQEYDLINISLSDNTQTALYHIHVNVTTNFGPEIYTSEELGTLILNALQADTSKDFDVLSASANAIAGNDLLNP